MRIGVDVRVLMEEHYSGISQYAANLLEALYRLDREDEFRLFYNSSKPPLARLRAFERPNASLRGSRFSNKIFNYLSQKILAYPKVDDLIGGADVFWSPHFNFTRLHAAVPEVVTVHDLSFLRYPEFFSFRQNLWHRALGVKSILRRASIVVAVSENTKDDIVELAGIAPDKVRVIYSGNNLSLASGLDPETGAETPAFKEAAAAFLRKSGLESRFLLFVGTIEPRKNIAGLIAAFEILKARSGFADLKLVLAGGRGWKNRRIYAAREASTFKDDIVFLGYISDQEREILYRRAAVFAYPSFYEGFGFPPLEALSAGLPVVCSNVSSLPEVVGAAAILVNPFSPEEIAGALETVLSDPDLAALLAARGREQARRFSWDETARRYLEIFKGLSGRK